MLLHYLRRPVIPHSSAALLQKQVTRDLLLTSKNTSPSASRQSSPHNRNVNRKEVVLDAGDMMVPDMANYLAQSASDRLHRNLIPKKHYKSQVQPAHSGWGGAMGTGDVHGVEPKHAFVSQSSKSHHKLKSLPTNSVDNSNISSKTRLPQGHSLDIDDMMDSVGLVEAEQSSIEFHRGSGNKTGDQVNSDSVPHSQVMTAAAKSHAYIPPQTQSKCKSNSSQNCSRFISATERAYYINKLTYEYINREERANKLREEIYSYDPKTKQKLFQPKIVPHVPSDGITIVHEGKNKVAPFEDLLRRDEEAKQRKILHQQREVEQEMKRHAANKAVALKHSTTILQESTDSQIYYMFISLLGHTGAVDTSTLEMQSVLDGTVELDFMKAESWMLDADMYLLVHESRNSFLRKLNRKPIPREASKPKMEIIGSAAAARALEVDAEDEPETEPAMINLQMFNKYIREAMKKRQGTGKAYLSVKKKVPRVALQLKHMDEQEETFKPTINDTSTRLSHKKGGRGTNQRAIEDILLSDGEKALIKIEEAKENKMRELEANLTFKPFLYKPPSYLREPRYRGGHPVELAVVEHQSPHLDSVGSIQRIPEEEVGEVEGYDALSVAALDSEGLFGSGNSCGRPSYLQSSGGSVQSVGGNRTSNRLGSCDSNSSSVSTGSDYGALLSSSCSSSSGLNVSRNRMDSLDDLNKIYVEDTDALLDSPGCDGAVDNSSTVHRHSDVDSDDEFVEEPNGADDQVQNDGVHAECENIREEAQVDVATQGLFVHRVGDGCPSSHNGSDRHSDASVMSSLDNDSDPASPDRDRNVNLEHLSSNGDSPRDSSLSHTVVIPRLERISEDMEDDDEVASVATQVKVRSNTSSSVKSSMSPSASIVPASKSQNPSVTPAPTLPKSKGVSPKPRSGYTAKLEYSALNQNPCASKTPPHQSTNSPSPNINGNTNVTPTNTGLPPLPGDTTSFVTPPMPPAARQQPQIDRNSFSVPLTAASVAKSYSPMTNTGVNTKCNTPVGATPMDKGKANMSTSTGGVTSPVVTPVAGSVNHSSPNSRPTSTIINATAKKLNSPTVTSTTNRYSPGSAVPPHNQANAKSAVELSGTNAIPHTSAGASDAVSHSNPTTSAIESTAVANHNGKTGKNGKKSKSSGSARSSTLRSLFSVITNSNN